MSIRFALLGALLCIAHYDGQAQRVADQSRNAVYVEGSTPISYVSLNCEYTVNEWVATRVGVGGFPIISGSHVTPGMPLLVNGTLGSGTFKFECGFGAIVPLDDSPLLWTGSLSVRFQPLNGGFFWRIGWRPVYLPADNEAIIATVLGLISVGASAGYCF